MSEPVKYKGCDSIAGRDCLITHRFGPLNQVFMIIGGKIKSPVLSIFKVLQHGVRQMGGEL